MNDLFDSVPEPEDKFVKPLAERLRPKNLVDVVGQEQILGARGLLSCKIRKNEFGSYILFGPPGSGKTTIARLIAADSQRVFAELSATVSGVSDLRKVFEDARRRKTSSRGTLLFVDEIHQFNKSQQDSLLPYLENGMIQLIGATTENPNFELNSALLSRVLILKLNALQKEDLETILIRSELLMKKKLPITNEARDYLLNVAQGDARKLTNLAEIIFLSKKQLTDEDVQSLITYKSFNYAKNGTDHFDLISALQKSIRGSDVDAALYWLARMMNSGENAHYIFRRVLRTSYEDIGLADLKAQDVCLSAWSTFERLGSPEGDIALAQAVIYLALATKSNSSYLAYSSAAQAASKTSTLLPAKHLTMNNFSRGGNELDSYHNDHDTAAGFSGQQFLPVELAKSKFYLPFDRGQEQELVKKLKYFNRLRAEKSL